METTAPANSALETAAAPTASRIRQTVGWLFCAVGAASFLRAALPKIAEPWPFLQSVKTYELFPEWALLPIVYGIPPLELVCAIALLLPGKVIPKAAWALTLTLLVAFTLAIIQGWLRGLSLDCGCYGTSGPTNYPVKVATNSALIFALAVGGWLRFARANRGHQTAPAAK